MKISYVLFIAIIFLAFGYSVFAQEDIINQPKPIIDVRGDENPDLSNAQVIESSSFITFDHVVSRGGLVWNVHNITDIKTGYDLQSNASTQQVWLDYTNPNFIHAIFTNSQQVSGWSDRTSLYFGSADAGVTWTQLGGVPVNNGTDGRSGYPVIYGLYNGSALISDHNNSNSSTFTHTKIYADSDPFAYNFTEYDPGNISDGPVWPRLTVTEDSIVIFASSGSPAPDDDVKLNTLDLKTGLFSGWQDLESDDAEQYDFSISPDGKIGLAYNGWDGATPDESGDVLYRESLDNGLTWSDPVKVFDRDESQDTALGSIRGVSVNFYGEEPCVTYEVCQQIFSSGNFFPGLPSEIHFWSPNVNGGVPKVIADSSNVPFYPYLGTNDVMVPVCRPVIGRADNGYLLIAFTATTEFYYPNADSTTYMAGYFTYSSDGGENWTDPEKFTPDSPLMDWRYPSITEVVPVAVAEDDVFAVHIVMQGDTIPGSTVNAAGMPVGVTAQYYHFSTDFIIQSADGNENVISNYTLEQNYPNPFNPNTTIRYSIPSQSFVELKVYDILGNEVATLVSEEKSIGNYQVNFDASSIPSGIYFYALRANNFMQTKKMVLVK